MHDDHTFNAKLIVQAQQVFKTGLIWRVLPVCGQRVAVSRSEHMGVAVATTGWQHPVWRLMNDAVNSGRKCGVRR
jgi:hypothetical protein